jgi:hypothetical protein
MYKFSTSKIITFYNLIPDIFQLMNNYFQLGERQVVIFEIHPKLSGMTWKYFGFVRDFKLLAEMWVAHARKC